MLAKPYRVESRAISRQTARTRTVGISREIMRLAAFLRELVGLREIRALAYFLAQMQSTISVGYLDLLLGEHTAALQLTKEEVYLLVCPTLFCPHLVVKGESVIAVWLAVEGMGVGTCRLHCHQTSQDTV